MVLTFKINPGERAVYEGRIHEIVSMVDVGSVLVRDKATGETATVSPGDLGPVPETSGQESDTESVASGDIADFSNDDWAEAERRYEAIRPLLEAVNRTRKAARTSAEQAGVSVTTVYDWLKRYEEADFRRTALIPKKRGRREGQTGLQRQVEDIVLATIRTKYLSKERPNVETVCQDIKRQCREAGVPSPHPNTVRARIKAISDRERVERRYGKKVARERFTPILGDFPDAPYPLSMFQIDHTQLDIILVDSWYRFALGRPYLTLVTDVFSRMIVGFYLSFDAPSELSTGQALVHAMLPKDKWLSGLEVEGGWPVWGKPVSVHVDNANEFTGHWLKQVSADHGIDMQIRPPGRPSFGGHVERLFGTLNSRIHTLPGTTFSNVGERGHYDAEKEAALTLWEFEKWLTEYIVNVYHHEYHEGLWMTPYAKWEEGIAGTPDRPGIGPPERFVNEDALRISFLPFETRTVQRYGIKWDNIHYYGHSLRRWIEARDPDNPEKPRKFRVRRDPRDISRVYFYDPELEEHFVIPYRDTSHPAISVWELRTVQARLKEQGRNSVNEDAIFAGLKEMERITEDAVKETKKAKRRKEQEKRDKKAIGSQTKSSPVQPGEPPDTEPSGLDDDDEDLKPLTYD
ncbi:MAG TPA: Mu transposase C-terminal domain-containing protein [Gammaproteobacteria bacterium]|nr:Mu transposase C-terminal domain-containing protein [Gammaproteobacteria bacterium]